MPKSIFFVHVRSAGQGPRHTQSIAFECDYATVADLITAFETKLVVAGSRIRWRDEKGRDGPPRRIITSRKGYALRRDEYSLIEEPSRPFEEEDDGRQEPPRSGDGARTLPGPS